MAHAKGRPTFGERIDDLERDAMQIYRRLEWIETIHVRGFLGRLYWLLTGK